ncbi:hypothetical protein Bca52824_016206 [Brassica carinata]|uniref:Uncharacterized protein n=1 Tax=Brassica carinata TaxID=52824 RepID=A0A8X7W6K5_BRACI|nr:hypothetical protein Bca52824_016206 [Brassica carinata]
MDEKLKDIYTAQYDSMNDFKCRLDSVYHPLNGKITWLTKTMECRRRYHHNEAENTLGFSKDALKPSTSNDLPHHTSTDASLKPSPDAVHPRSIDNTIEQSNDIRFTRLEEKLYSLKKDLPVALNLTRIDSNKPRWNPTEHDGTETRTRGVDPAVVACSGRYSVPPGQRQRGVPPGVGEGQHRAKPAGRTVQASACRRPAHGPWSRLF